MTTDVHAHYCPANYRDLIGAAAPQLAPAVLADGWVHVGGRRFPPMAPAMHDLEARARTLDDWGLDRQVLSVPPALFMYWAEPEAAARVARTLNESMAAAVSSGGARFIGFATVPLQDPGLATAELEYAIRRLGLSGVEIGASVEGGDLDNPEFEPFWTALERLSCPVFIHPHAFVGDSRVADYYLAQILGFPFDTSIAISRLILGGVLDRHPRLRLCAAHGGGTIPYLKGRLDAAARLGLSPAGSEQPSTMLGRLYYDSLLQDCGALRFLLDAVGQGRVVVGTDCPFRLSEADPLRRLRDCGLNPAELAAVAGKNCDGFLGTVNRNGAARWSKV